jgi:glycosyltransferase involved in cell wall biosynthesis
MNFPAAEPAVTHVPARRPGRALPALVVFSPLRWHFDWQRPQQLLTRLAKHYRVLYVEEPVTTHAEDYLAASCPAPGVEVLVPHTGVDAPGFHAAQVAPVQALLADHLRRNGIERPLVWVCTPMAQPLVEPLRPRGVLVDLLEDLAAAPDAPAVLREREAALMALADVVVAGGPSLYQSRRGQHPNVHCIPNAVDADHFAPPSPNDTSIEAVSARSLHAAIPGPRLGWFGVVDERLDFALVDRLARLRPDWQLILAGPVRVDAATLPRRPNLHWIGPQTYAIRPHLLAHWDACILPLHCEAAARHASPPAVLEFLAGQKPVVSTPVHDVVALHGHIVRLASDADGFAEACRAALAERGPLRRQRRIDSLIAVHSSSWDRAADRIHKLLTEFAHEPAPAFARAAALAAGRAQHAVGARYAIG